MMVNARLKCVTIQLLVWMRQKEFQEFARKSGLTIHSCLPMQILVFWKPSWHTQYHTYSHIFLSAMQIHTCIQITWRYAAVGSPPSLQLTSLPQLQGQADPAASSVGIWPGSGGVVKILGLFLVVGLTICAFGFVIGQQIQLFGCYLVVEMCCCFSANFWWLIRVQGRRKGSTEFPSHSSMKRPQERKTEPQEVPGLNLTSSLVGVSSSSTCNVVSCK